MRPCAPTAHSKNNYFEKNVKRFQGVLEFKAHRRWYPSTLGLRMIKKKKHPHRPMTMRPTKHPSEERTSIKGVKDFHLKNGSSQGQNQAVTLLYAPNSLGSGRGRISQKVSTIVFAKVNTHKFGHLFFIYVIVEDKLTNLCETSLLQNNFINMSCQIRTFHLALPLSHGDALREAADHHANHFRILLISEMTFVDWPCAKGFRIHFSR